MEYKKLDKIDSKIIEILSENSRTSYVNIGKKVNLSRVAVKSRIENLEKSEIIEKYTIETNLRKLSGEVSVFFDIEVEPSKLIEIGKKLAHKSKVTDVYQMTGEGNLHVHAMLNLNDELGEFLSNELYNVEGVKKVTNRLIITRFKSRIGEKL